MPRTPEVEAIARSLMLELADAPEFAQEGKMYGVLLAQTAAGDILRLQGFSGLLQGQAVVEGWVPPLPGRAQVALAESLTLAKLAALTTEILNLKALPEREQYMQQQRLAAQGYQALLTSHQQRRRDRQTQRQSLNATLIGPDLEAALATLERQSQQDKRQRRQLNQDQQQQLASLKAICEQADQRIRALKQQRKQLSRQLQAQLHAVYRVQNFAGDSRTLQELMPEGLPSGTGDCAAPKLLHYAASQGLQPLALAEFWWGPAQGDKQPGQFYGP
ncbi:MAG: RluA family pseudouridine synthase, partial [Cyanobacteria bacterium P01_H01_bin.121]